MTERRPSVLLVEDEVFVQTLLAAYLEREGIVVTVASTAAEMRAALRMPAQPFDAIALDLGLPDEEGLALVRQLRTRLDVPICITTRDDSAVSRSVAAELGVNDYLVKPFHPQQLIASLMALLGRRPSGKDTTVQFEGWSFDSVGRLLTNRQGEAIALTPSELDVLAALVAAAGRSVSRAHLLDAIASDSIGTSSRVVDVIVSSLRRKLGDPARMPRLIVTVPGVGYRFSARPE
ncbi:MULTISPECIES: response regulator transcription factor [unclassified Bradyrhizobium]|uniref:response regulator transcription factor n=1 Tax=unclassified Bradyrhizobium TaxID=2631580 RepID=UPI0024B0A250|nr:response regulator transcription factor [Bradyrhizobium sp. CB2312]WFU76745.1 response regulator transcription factor [Bradyrhizobium sp. CB2312]